jgi:hypothetical protein
MSSVSSLGGGSYTSHGGGDASLTGSQRSGRRLRKSKRPDPLYNGQHRHRSPSPLSRSFIVQPVIVQPDPFFTTHGRDRASITSKASNKNNTNTTTTHKETSAAKCIYKQLVRDRSLSPPPPHSVQPQPPQDQSTGNQHSENTSAQVSGANDYDRLDRTRSDEIKAEPVTNNRGGGPSKAQTQLKGQQDDPVAAAKLELRRLKQEQQKTQQEVSDMAQHYSAKPSLSLSPPPPSSSSRSPRIEASSSSLTRGGRQIFASRQQQGNGSGGSGSGLVDESTTSLAYSDRSLNYADGKSLGGDASLAYSLESSNTFLQKMEENLEGRFVNLSKQKDANGNGNNNNNNSEFHGHGVPSAGYNGTSASASAAAASPARSNVYSVVHEEEDDEEEEIAQYVSSASSSDDEYGPFGNHYASASVDNDNETDLDDQVSLTPSKASMGMEEEGGDQQHHFHELTDNYHDGATATTVSDPVTAITTASTSASTNSILDPAPARSPSTAYRSSTSTAPSSPIRTQFDRSLATDEGEESAASAVPTSPAHDAYANARLSPATRLPNESLREFWERRERDGAKKTEAHRQSLTQTMDPDEAQRAQDKIKRFKSLNVPHLTPLPLQQQAQAPPKQQGAGPTVTFEDEQLQSSLAIPTLSAAAIEVEEAPSEAQANGNGIPKDFSNQSSSTLESLKANDTSLNTSILSEGGKLEPLPTEDDSNQVQHPTSLLNLLGGDSSDEEEQEHQVEDVNQENTATSKSKVTDTPAYTSTTEKELERSPVKDAAIVSAAAPVAEKQETKSSYQDAGKASDHGVKETASKNLDQIPPQPHKHENASEVESNFPRHLPSTAQGDEAAGVVRESKALGSGPGPGSVPVAYIEAPKPETALVAVDQDADQAPQGETIRSNSTGWSSSRSVPNLHRDLAICAWSRLDRHLVKLSKYPKVMLQALAQQNPDLGNATPLHTACWKAPPPLALHMISLLTRVYKHMERICLATDLDGNTPLHLSAANSCHSDPAEHYGDYDVFSGKDEIYGAIDSKSIPGFKESDVIEALVLSAPKALTTQNEEGDTPLHLAVSSSSSMERVVTCLIDKPEADACLLQDCSGATPLHAAIGNQVSLQVLEIIFRPAPEASRMVDNLGLLPLHYVAAFCHTPISFVKQLLKAHPGAISTCTADGDTPLHLAISNAKEEGDEGNDEEANVPNEYDADGKEYNHKTLTIDTIRLLLGDYPLVDPRNPVFIKNQAEVRPKCLYCKFDTHAPKSPPPLLIFLLIVGLLSFCTYIYIYIILYS